MTTMSSNCLKAGAGGYESPPGSGRYACMQAGCGVSEKEGTYSGTCVASSSNVELELQPTAEAQPQLCEQLGTTAVASMAATELTYA